MKTSSKENFRNAGKAESAESKDSKQSGAKSKFRLKTEQLTRIHDLMVKARVLEERLIRMYKQNDGYFWIGGPGEEAFNIPLGLQVKKGMGKDFDYLHLHYRSSGIMTAMGMEPVDALRQMKNVASDPFSGGRNFVNHYSRREWNVVPGSSTIETQYLSAIGTAIAQRRHGGTGLTIVNGGDAGTAEGDFASCLVWASRPGFELPLLIIVTNNQWGISTPASTQHGEKRVADRGKAFGIRTATINGNDVEESWFALEEAMSYIRRERKPFLLEANVSRLYGHSSASGANRTSEELDSLTEFEKQLESGGVLTRKKMDELREAYNQQMLELSQKVKEEPMPDPSTIYDHIYYGQKGRYW
ncbi:MAG: thiamine pyrophosphate-dependent dehydrogenase E1 component subunit alpha [Oligoflexia bacterium]|nr:thiamine pyrophosphate-dependent dehydrogenase E1 component subunit alpha [Oligoflexia bacterium]